jgi:molybdopterin/thiamine biosynthesis adenylyltransferase
MAFVKEELERYSRQILLAGSSAQETLKKARVLVIGAGGLGATILPALAASGVGALEFFDSDVIERSNLGRQLIYRESDLGKNKAMTAAAYLSGLNPYVEIIARPEKFTAEWAGSLETAGMIVEGTDSLACKFLVNDLAVRSGKPALIAALGRAQGHSMFIARGQACYRCVFDELQEGDIPTCAAEGILSTFPAVIGAAVAHAVVTHLLGDGPCDSTLYLFEKNHCRKVLVKKRQDCKKHT